MPIQFLLPHYVNINPAYVRPSKRNTELQCNKNPVGIRQDPIIQSIHKDAYN